MPLLLIDPERALETSADCSRLAGRSDGLVSDLVGAAMLSDLAIEVAGPLSDVAETLRSVATALKVAADDVSSFALPPLALTPHAPWNQVRQVASHNTYQSPTGLQMLHADGVRSFELDLHRGAPTSRSIWQSPFELIADALTHGSRSDPEAVDWPIYHHSLDSESSHAFLSHALDDIAALDSAEPITLFVDVKDSFGGSQTADALDAMLIQRFGERLFTPADLRTRSSPVASLQRSLDDEGWPSVAELHGRVIVVLTDEIEQYQVERAGDAVAFVAAPPTVAAIADPNVVFYNVRSDALSELQVVALQSSGGVIRTWGPPTAAGSAANYFALDL